MTEVEEYVDLYINNDVEIRNSTFLNYVDNSILYTEEYHRNRSNDGAHRIIGSDMFQNNDSLEGLSGYESFCDKNT
jgi:hypothetical protein